MNITLSERKQMAELIGDLADLASYKDIDLSVILAERLADLIRVKPNEIKGLAELRGM